MRLGRMHWLRLAAHFRHQWVQHRQPQELSQGGRDVGVSGPLANEDVVGDALLLADSVSLC